VDTAQLRIVQQQLNGHVEKVRSDARLGLSLVTLYDIDKAAAAVSAELEAELEAELSGATRQVAAGPPPAESLERLLADLRTLFGAKYGKWYPSMGKNRTMHGLQLTPYPFAEGADIEKVPAADGQAAYDAGRGAPNKGHGVEVGVLDTPVYDHPRLAGRYYADDDARLEPTGEPRAWWAGHATSIAGRIAQQAPGAELRIHSVLAERTATASVWEVAGMLAGFAGSGLDILNLSFGCFTDDGKPPMVLQRAIQRLTPTMVVVAAAGNHGEPRSDAAADQLPQPQTPLWPAAFDDVVAVGATEDDGTVTSFTPTGSPLDAAGRPVIAPWIDLLAPGRLVTSLYLDEWVKLPEEPVRRGRSNEPVRRGRSNARTPVKFDGYARWSGTSFAAAAVSGALAALTVPGRRTANEALRLLIEKEHIRKSLRIRLP
jgi:subtilisin family serine protease